LTKAATLAVAVAGASGRMGRMLIEAVVRADDCRLGGALDVPGSPALGQDAAAFLGADSGIRVTSELRQGIAGTQVLIDFTRPEGTMAHLAVCRELGVSAVIGTTGLSAAQKDELARVSQRIPIVHAANMSVGVVVLLRLVELAAQRLGPEFDIEVVEMHHKHKVDAPSGTALALGEAAAAGAGRALADCAVYVRQGHTGERPPGTIGFATLRGGDVVGEHTVVFAGTGERVELSHKATSRQNFATGALRAARYVAARRAAGEVGFADMRAVLGLD
jgi:4-hydroxy-tetrahydrodipicolinate reductase